MRHLAKRILIGGAAVLLTGCLWGPGKFTSNLAVMKDGSFTLDYKGEIVIAVPDVARPEPWKDAMARCYKSGRTEAADGAASPVTPDEDDPVRACTASEKAALKTQYDSDAAQKAAAKTKDNAEMAKVFGLPGIDAASGRAFAAKLSKYAGWRSVAYRGKGVFDVDYHFAGRTSQDFLFPMLPDNALIVPFIAIRRRTDGALLVSAPAMTGKGGLGGSSGGSAMPMDGPPSRAEGRLTITTDGEVLTNNSEDGAVRSAAGQQLHWDLSPASSKVPETLIKAP